MNKGNRLQTVISMGVPICVITQRVNNYATKSLNGYPPSILLPIDP